MPPWDKKAWVYLDKPIVELYVPPRTGRSMKPCCFDCYLGAVGTIP